MRHRNKIIILFTLMAMFIVVVMLFGPKQRIDFKSVRAEIPFGWKAEGNADGDEFEILMLPRSVIFGRGMIKINYHACENVGNAEELLKFLNADLLEPDYRSEQVGERSWLRNESPVEGIVMYQAKTVLKAGWCLGVTGEPLKSFDDVLKSVSILN